MKFNDFLLWKTAVSVKKVFDFLISFFQKKVMGNMLQGILVSLELAVQKVSYLSYIKIS